MKKPGLTTVLVVLWLACAAGGSGWMLVNAGRPGAEGAAPALWPESSQLRRAPGRPVLLMFLHPRCPCSRASLGELAVLLAHGGAGVEVRAVFLAPAKPDAGWSDTDLWHTAEALPGVTVARDAAGREAQLFGAGTSGDTLLYDGTGRLLFHGGITPARGHSGDNRGRSAIEALLQGGRPLAASTRVFGCGLFAREDRGETWKR